MRKEYVMPTVINKGTQLRGNINSINDIRVDGEVTGDLTSEGLVYVGESGNLVGNIKSFKVVLEGRVKGNIRAGKECIIRPKGNLTGNIETRHASIMENAFFDGRCIITNTTNEGHIKEINPVKSEVELDENLQNKIEVNKKQKDINSRTLNGFNKGTNLVNQPSEQSSNNIKSEVTEDQLLSNTELSSSLFHDKIKNIKTL